MYFIFKNNAKIKVDLYHFLPLEKTLTFYNAIIHIKSDQRHYYYNTLLV